MVRRSRKIGSFRLGIVVLGLVLAAASLYAQSDKAKEAFNKGITAQKAGKLDDAVAAYKDAITADAEYLDAYRNLGAVYFEKGSYDDALKTFQTATEKNPKSADAFADLGKVQLAKRNFVEAEAAFKKAIALDDKNVDLQKQLARVYMARSAWPELAQTCEKLNQDGSGNDTTWYWLGKAYEKQDKSADAITAYQKSISLRAKNYSANFALGQIYLQKEDYESAAKSFKAALTADPKGFKAAMNYAIAVETKNPDNYAANIGNWQEFLRVAGSNPKAKEDVATAQSHLKELKDALKAKGN